ncbi:MAG: hypothetical protein R3272_08355 [Candidatus Promineifilaceae bacterium]|nr:hypothetical protein [Candidatus Promineifilaceae bacterium]
MLARPGWLIAIGTFLVLIGFVLPWLMVLRIVDSTLLLNFFAYICMIGGAVVGTVGAVLYREEEGGGGF